MLLLTNRLRPAPPPAQPAPDAAARLRAIIALLAKLADDLERAR